MQTRRPHREPVALALLCALILSLALAAGCAGGGEAEPSSETNGAAPAATSADSPDTTSNISEEKTREVAEKALLTLRDFPAGWSQLPPDKDEDVPLDLPPECQVFAEMQAWPGTLVDIDSPEFEGPNEEKVDSSVIVYVDDESARKALADAKAAIDLCKEPMHAAFAKSLQESLRADHPDVAIEVVAFAMDWLEFPSYGDDSAALRMSFTINVGAQSLVFHTDIFGWRVGRIEGDMSFFTVSEEPDSEEEQRLAQIIEKRLRDAVKDLD